MEDRLVGTVLSGRYRLLDLVGSGGMAKVYKAEDILENRLVAIKMLRDEYVGNDEFRKRFLNESRAITMLVHRNIVDVFDVNFDENCPYIVMELIEGITLKDYMKKKSPLPLREALLYCGQILSALRHAHERGVVHRDIKPQNIMLLNDGVVKVTDFGIAQVSNFETVTHDSSAVGSVHYVSPEQARGRVADDRSDIYSTGIMLYEMVTGTLPFTGENPVSVALKQVQEEPKRPRQINPEIPVGLEQIIMKAMRKKPDERYSNAREMQHDIVRFLEDQQVVFDYPDGFGSVRKPENKKQKTAGTGKKILTEKQIIRKNRMIAALSGIFLALVLVVTGTFVMFTMVQRLGASLLDIPQLVGRTLSEVQKDKQVTDHFNLVIEERNDSVVAAGIIIEQTPAEGRYSSGTEMKVIVSKGPRMTTVPAVTNLVADQAAAQLKSNELSCEKLTEVSASVEKGHVIRCEPADGSSVPVGTTVKIFVAASGTDNMVKVPDVRGLSRDSAMAALYAKNLDVTTQETYSDTVESGLVISQSLEELSEVEAGSKITIYISKGKQTE